MPGRLTDRWRPADGCDLARRDLATATTLTQYKGNNSAASCFCTVGRDYFAAAQAAKDAVHFYAYHKVRRARRAAAAASRRCLRPLAAPLHTPPHRNAS